MWSATWPKDVEELAEDFLENRGKNPDLVHLNIGSTGQFFLARRYINMQRALQSFRHNLI